MDLTNASTVGIAVLVGIALMGGYLMLLQIRESMHEKPDPKLTYLPKADYEAQSLRLRNQLDELSSLVHQNAQQTSALIAQVQMLNQRMAEQSIKIDRLQERLLA